MDSPNIDIEICFSYIFNRQLGSGKGGENHGKGRILSNFRTSAKVGRSRRLQIVQYLSRTCPQRGCCLANCESSLLSASIEERLCHYRKVFQELERLYDIFLSKHPASSKGSARPSLGNENRDPVASSQDTFADVDHEELAGDRAFVQEQDPTGCASDLSTDLIDGCTGIILTV